MNFNKLAYALVVCFQAGGLAPVHAETTDPRNLAPVIALSNKSHTAMDLMRCLADKRLPLASAHRGGPIPGYPENAIETFQYTLSQAPMLVEVDVRTSKDGVLHLMHDDTLERTSTGTGKINDWTSADLAKLRLKDNDGKVTDFRIPTVAEAIEAIRGRGILVLDVKEDESLAPIVKTIQETNSHAFVIINAYRPAHARLVHGLDRHISLSHPVYAEGDLEILEISGVHLQNVMAWTGIEHFEGRNEKLWALLDQRGIPTLYATLFVEDKNIQKSGNTQIFLDVTEKGVDAIASDLHMTVYKVLSKNRDVAKTFASCDK